MSSGLWGIEGRERAGFRAAQEAADPAENGQFQRRHFDLAPVVAGPDKGATRPVYPLTLAHLNSAATRRLKNAGVSRGLFGTDLRKLQH